MPQTNFQTVRDDFWYRGKPFICALIAVAVLLWVPGTLAKTSGVLLLIVAVVIFALRQTYRRRLRAAEELRMKRRTKSGQRGGGSPSVNPSSSPSRGALHR